MKINIKKTDQYTVIGISGRLDATNAFEFEKKMITLFDKGEIKFLIDLSALEYISSSGLRVFLISAKKIENKHGKIVIVSAKPNVKEVFEITGFSTFLPMFDSMEEAEKNMMF